jgi:hypothetical protein
VSTPEKLKVNYWMISTILLVLIVFLEFFFFNKDFLLSQLYNNRSINNETGSSKSTPSLSGDNLEWRTVTSERARLSFKYPSTWPLDFESEEELKKEQSFYGENSPDYYLYPIEFIDFTEKWYRNAGGERYGFISVGKQRNVTTLDDYVKFIDNPEEVLEDLVKGVPIKYKNPRPKIKYSVIGGEVAVTEYPQGDFARLDSPNDDLNFIVVKNGLIYRFSALKSDRFTQNEEQNTKIFRDIISSVKFLD